MKRRIDIAPAMSRGRLKEEIIIEENGPNIVDAEPLMKRGTDVFLMRHREPIMIDSKFEFGQVIDTELKKKSKFDWIR